MSTRLSIIVPLFGVAAFLRDCLDSLVAQDAPGLEFILVDDGSPDDCASIAREYIGRDGRIRLIVHERNLGQGGARNTGLAAATGEYIWFVDGDDWIAPGACGEILSELERSGADVLEMAACWVYENKPAEIQFAFLEEGLFEGPDAVIGHVGKTVFSNYACFRVFRRALIEACGARFLEKTIMEDNIMLAWLLTARSVLAIGRPYYFYRIRGDGSLRSFRPDYPEHSFRVAAQLHDFFAARGFDDTRRMALLRVLVVGLVFWPEHALKVWRRADAPRRAELAAAYAREWSLLGMDAAAAKAIFEGFDLPAWAPAPMERFLAMARGLPPRPDAGRMRRGLDVNFGVTGSSFVKRLKSALRKSLRA